MTGHEAPGEGPPLLPASGQASLPASLSQMPTVPALRAAVRGHLARVWGPLLMPRGWVWSDPAPPPEKGSAGLRTVEARWPEVESTQGTWARMLCWFAPEPQGGLGASALHL